MCRSKMMVVPVIRGRSTAFQQCRNKLTRGGRRDAGSPHFQDIWANWSSDPKMGNHRIEQSELEADMACESGLAGARCPGHGDRCAAQRPWDTCAWFLM